MIPQRSPIALAVLALAACNAQAPSTSKLPAEPPASSATQRASDAVRGTIAEKIDTAQYTYLKLRTASGELWTAVPKTDQASGTEVAVVNVAWMQDFHSDSLNRTWPRIAFGTLEEKAAQMPPGHPPLDAAQGNPHGRPPAAPLDAEPIRVAPAPGAAGRTIADIWARRSQLKDQTVAVRGKVVKATNGVLGKNWLHLRDGTGEGASGDLTVASTDTAAVGETVLVTGLVHVDRDLGAGYRYEVLVEEARVKKE